ncbi:hypothetical protein Cpir12675_000605 [Ceratocystis pirilliformis]|uniref:Uncharacterized protein n=1 Tax=Ceratocystis pirilliformis TaxID=259994 RepID=A0ABR3ZLE9_9PEZI
MKLSLASLPLAISPLNLALPSHLEYHGYQVIRSGYIDAVLPRGVDSGYQYLDMFGFYPWMNSVVIYSAEDYKEPERDDKLSMADIYSALAEDRNIKLEGIEWVISEIGDDLSANMLIDSFRRDRDLGYLDEFTIYPGDKEWEAIRDNQHFQRATLIKGRAAAKVLVRNIEQKMLGELYQFVHLHFHFPMLEFKEPEDTASVSVNDNPNDSQGSARKNGWKQELKKLWQFDLESDEADEALTTFLAEQYEQEVASLLAMNDQLSRLFPELDEEDDDSISST